MTITRTFVTRILAAVAVAVLCWPVALFVFGVAPERLDGPALEVWHTARLFWPGLAAAAAVIGLGVAAELADRRYGDRLCGFARRFAVTPSSDADS